MNSAEAPLHGIHPARVDARPTGRSYNRPVDPAEIRGRVKEHVRRHELIPPGGDVTCLVSGGPDSTCLWHVLGDARLRACPRSTSNHGLRGEESEDDARFCAERARRGGRRGAGRGPERGRAARPAVRGCAPTGCARPATPHRTRSRRSSTGSSRAGRPPASACGATTASSGRSSASGARRPRPTAEPRACLPARLHQRGHEARPHPRRDPAAAAPRCTPPPSGTCSPRSSSRGGCRAPIERALAELLASHEGSKRLDLGGGRVAVREYERVWLERGPVRLTGRSSWGGWTIEPRCPGSSYAGWRPATGLPGTAGRRCRISSSMRRSPIGAGGVAARRAGRRGGASVPGVAARAGLRESGRSQRGAGER